MVSDNNFNNESQKTILLQLQLLDDGTQPPVVATTPPPPSTSTPSPPSSPPLENNVGGLDFATGLIIGIVIILILVALAGLGLFLHRRKQKQRRKFFLKRLQMEDYDASDRYANWSRVDHSNQSIDLHVQYAIDIMSATYKTVLGIRPPLLRISDR